MSLAAEFVPFPQISTNAKLAWMAFPWILQIPLAKSAMIFALLAHHPILQIALLVTQDGPSNHLLTFQQQHVSNVPTKAVELVQPLKLAHSAKIHFIWVLMESALIALAIAKFVQITSLVLNATMVTL